MRNLEALYDEFKAIGKLEYSHAGYKRYKELAKRIFPLLKAEYLSSGEKAKTIEDIINALSEEDQDPLKFWGSEKTADRNHYVYIADKEGRLFEELQSWYEKRIGYDQSGKTCTA